MADEEPAEIRRARGAALIEISREDLEAYGLGELEERIAALEVEIARTRAQIGRKQAGEGGGGRLVFKARLGEAPPPAGAGGEPPDGMRVALDASRAAKALRREDQG